MGNSAAKEIHTTTTLSDGNIEDSMSIAPSLVSKEAIVAKRTGMGKTWENEKNGEVLFHLKGKGVIKSHTLVEDAKGKILATIIIHKLGLGSATNYICKSGPVFEDQAALDAEQLKKAGIDEGIMLYPFGMIVSKQDGMASSKSTYSVVTGKKEDGSLTTKVVYTGEKLSAMNFYAMFKAADKDTIVAKAVTKGISMNPTLEAAAGVDLLAIICIGNALASGGSSAGGLAGAGVV